MKEEKIWAVKDGYLVLRNGTIFSLNWRNTGKCVEVKQTNNGNGYLCFRCNGKMIKSHRFIASCFIPNPQNLPFINHKNEIKNDNRVENLEWCDHKYNINYGSRNKRVSESMTGIKRSKETRKKISESQKNDPKRSKKVLQFTKDGVFVKEWVSLHEIERVLGFNKGNISQCCNNKSKYKTAYDHLWRFKDDLLS